MSDYDRLLPECELMGKDDLNTLHKMVDDAIRAGGRANVTSGEELEDLDPELYWQLMSDALGVLQERREQPGAQSDYYARIKAQAHAPQEIK